MFDLKTSEVRSSEKDDIAAWFIDTDYDEESFFVRHAYFLGANDPYKSLKTSLKAEIDREAWETLYRDKSRPFARPSTGRFAVKVINHFGVEVDALIACGFNFDAHSSDLTKMGPLPILKAKMNQDLHMSDELKNTGKGNLFTIIGEPDIEWNFDDDGNIVVEVLGLDVFDLKTSEVRSSEKDDIAAWFIDTDYDEESFFVRHAYFLGANDPYKSLKTSLKAEIDREAWETLYRDKSRPFARPSTGRFAVKVINHFGDEVMKVFGV